MSRGEYEDWLADFFRGSVSMGGFLTDVLAPPLSDKGAALESDGVGWAGRPEMATV